MKGFNEMETEKYTSGMDKGLLLQILGEILSKRNEGITITVAAK